MSPSEDTNQTLNTNTPSPIDPDCCNKIRWWPLWLLGSLILLFLIMIIILRGLCSDVWYINLLKLNDKLCSGQSSLQQNVNLRDGSIRGPEIADGAIGLDNLSPSLQASITNINNQLANPVPGPQGSAGFNGLTGPKGSTGSTGATGPAGPTDPCVGAGTYFCQGGNTYGTLAVLGTNDTEDLQVVTGGLSNTKFDVQGNLIINRNEDVTGLITGIDALSVSNLITSANTFFGSSITDTESSNIVVDSSSVNNVTYSKIFAALSTVDGVTLSDANIEFSGVSDLNAFYGNIANSTVDNLFAGHGYLNETTLTDVFGFYGFAGWATIDDVRYMAGKFEGVDLKNNINIVGQFGYYTCDPMLGCSGPEIFDIHDSVGILGNAIATNIYDSSNVVINTSSSDPSTFISTISDVNNSTISGIDIDISGTRYSSIVGDLNSVVGLEYSTVIGESVTLDAGADPTYNYSFLGADSTGAINTRINFKGDDSWLNASGGGVGIGTTTPAGTLDVDGTTYLRTTTASAVGDEAVCRDPGTNEITIAVGATDCTLSSERFKHNIEELGLGLDFINGLRAVSYNRNSDGLAEVGFIAEEVARLDSRLVFFEQDGETARGVKYNQLTAILTNAIQEQDGKLEGINTQLAEQGLRLDSLSAELQALAGRVDSLEASDSTQNMRIKQLETEVEELKKLVVPVLPIP